MRVITAFVLSAICLLLISSIEPVIGYKSEQIKTSRDIYQRAIDRSYQELAATTHEILNNSDIKQNIEWGLSHSVAGILSQYLNPKSLTHSQIMDDQCQVLAASNKIQMDNSPCSKSVADNEKNYFFWTNKNNQSWLHLLSSFYVNKNRYYLMTSQELNKIWINQHTELARLWAPLKLSIGSKDLYQDKATLVTEEGKMPDGSYSASLYSSDPLVRLLPETILRKKNHLRHVTLIASIITFIMLISVIISLSIRENKHQRQIDQFYHWLENINQSQKIAYPEKNTKRSLSSTIKQVQEAVEDQHRMNLARERSHQDRIDKLNYQITVIEKELLERSSKLHLLQRQSSAKDQLKEVSRSFLQMQQDTYDQLENLNDIIIHSLAAPMKNLSSLINRWRREISLVSTRKFLRNLDERFEHHIGKTHLEIDFETILRSIDQIQALTMQGAIYGQNTLKNSAKSIKTAEHFLALSGGEENYDLTLSEIICNGQNLLPAMSSKMRCLFTNQLDNAYKPAANLLPPSTWSSIIYHLHSAIIHSVESEKPSSLHFLISQKKRGEQMYLVITLDDEHSDQTRPIEYSQKSKEHIEHARHLVHLSPLKILVLPSIVGISPLALIWPDQPCYHNTDDTPAKESPANRRQLPSYLEG